MSPDVLSPAMIRAILVVVLGATGTWLLLPHRHGRLKPRSAHVLGGVLTAIATILLATLWTSPGATFSGFFFYVFGIAAVAAAIMTITSRDPVYSALWFAAVVLATAGLFLLAGAQFLAAGTVIVYAGAIIVTFLFVIMLAQREGRATYDRMARAPGRATLTCFLLLWSLLYTVLSVRGAMAGPKAGERYLVRGSELASYHSLRGDFAPRVVLEKALSRTSRLSDAESNRAEGQHVAGLGAALYTDHLVTVELAGALLFVALIAALMIAAPKPPVRPARAVVQAA